MLASGPRKPHAAAAPVPTLVSRVQAALEQSSYLSHRPIECVEEEQAVVLQGWVRSYFEKQIAQTLAADVDGIERVINKLEVAGRSVKPR
ncbi:MAG: BON domain-containing protein [Maioricimonas sp. JB045]|uniref:BON domain-containing protein n=1 Tax=Maioricimonas sp. JC845 TaxID=3232138 RepID=UPI00345B3F89